MPHPLAIVPEKFCQNCGAELFRKRFGKTRTLEDASVFGRRKYCSLSCFGGHKAKDTVNPTKGTYHRRARKLIGSACEACGFSMRLIAHHVDQDFTNNSPENIQTLCKQCHDFWHSTQERTNRPIAGRMPRLLPPTGGKR